MKAATYTSELFIEKHHDKICNFITYKIFDKYLKKDEMLK